MKKYIIFIFFTWQKSGGGGPGPPPGPPPPYGAGPVNTSFFNKDVKDLCVMFELNHLIKDPTCFKTPNPSCIDNFYTNKKTWFFNSSTMKTAISDYHSLICTMFRSKFCEGPPKFISYSCYNNYKKEEFQNILKQRLCCIVKNFRRNSLMIEL